MTSIFWRKNEFTISVDKNDMFVLFLETKITRLINFALKIQSNSAGYFIKKNVTVLTSSVYISCVSVVEICLLCMSISCEGVRTLILQNRSSSRKSFRFVQRFVASTNGDRMQIISGTALSDTEHGAGIHL